MHFRRLLSAFAIASLSIATVSIAAESNSYQVTGPVLALTPTTVVVQKDKDKWEIARDAATPIKGELKVGAKVTIKYRMTAISIEAKDK